MATIGMKELAKQLNLSTATISKALRDSYDISDETKHRVLKLAEKLNYIPNAHASSLRGKKSKTLAMVIPEVADSYFAQAINGVEAIAQAAGFHVLVYLTHEQYEKEKSILKELLNGRVDGVLISVTSQSEDVSHINELRRAGIPVVFFDRVFEDIGNGEVTTDDFNAAYLLTQHLISQHCKNIAFLSFSNSLSINTLRLNGYKSALLDHGLNLEKKNLLACFNQEDENKVLIKKHLLRKNRPDGIIASVEKLITPLYLACQETKLSIPKDIKVAAFSNLANAAILAPPITTVTQPAFEMGKAAASLLIKALKGTAMDTNEQKIILPSKLEIRQSSSRTFS